MDELDSLIRALSRVSEELRSKRVRKKKRPRKPSTPSNTGKGANQGCGTGKGGFSAGNSCAKEDGRPSKPKLPKSFAQGGKSAIAASLPATKEALKAKAATLKKMAKDTKAAELPAKLKKKRIEDLRRKAAERKKEKGERDAAEKKAAEEAAAKKRAAMLQKIRVKKANEKLQVIEKPAENPTQPKKPGESDVEYVVRMNKPEFDRLHKTLDDIESRHDITQLEGAIKNFRAAIRHRKETIAATKDKEAAKQASKEIEDLNKEIERATELADRRLQTARREMHDAVTEFVSRSGSGLSTADPKKAIRFDVKTSKRKDRFRDNVGFAYSWLNRSLSPDHQAAISEIKVVLDRSATAQYKHATRSAVHGTAGINADYHTSQAVIVHEVAHGLHYGAGDVPSAGAARAIARIKNDHFAREQRFLEANPNARKVQYSSDSPYYLGFKKAGSRESPLGYASLYAGFENGNPTGATEVISVGIEQMFRDPSRFRRGYRGHFDLTLAFMSGMLHR